MVEAEEGLRSIQLCPWECTAFMQEQKTVFFLSDLDLTQMNVPYRPAAVVSLSNLSCHDLLKLK